MGFPSTALNLRLQDGNGLHKRPYNFRTRNCAVTITDKIYDLVYPAVRLAHRVDHRKHLGVLPHELDFHVELLDQFGTVGSDQRD